MLLALRILYEQNKALALQEVYFLVGKDRFKKDE
jgi:hypothetical protein